MACKVKIIGVRRIDHRATCFNCLTKDDIEQMEDIVFSDSFSTLTCYKCHIIIINEQSNRSIINE